MKDRITLLISMSPWNVAKTFENYKKTYLFNTICSVLFSLRILDDHDELFCFCGMVYTISCREHCQRPSPSRISDTPWAGFEHAQNLSLGLVEWSCVVVITITPRRIAFIYLFIYLFIHLLIYSFIYLFICLFIYLFINSLNHTHPASL